ncbi:ATP-binding protein [Alkaliphilus oremlandii]|uniref:4Fe-4S ferredoxin iron-sulfur binding domain protein n=1 Tax=Alkaliphilus oremlandii (strain OhILAs) TaxID=350688 RepID=A8MGV1_ALKOO|nr:4Fe-4S binding protein [Alkaliphilus oremlandii]ABW18645.1 4Fe-4S ferredoxin iron-sulfur binding domain protein [Alkaliphilus oremlandii OhILAs]
MLLKYFIQKMAVENVPKIEKKSCLHYRNANDPCNNCIESCPTAAIVKRDQAFVIEDELCIGCGICKVKCPSQSISMVHFGENTIPKAIKSCETVVFGCNYGKSEGNVMVPCLNGLHPELLALLLLHFKDKKLKFNLSKCSTCAIDSKALTFEVSLKKALAFLENIKSYEEPEVILDECEVPNISPRSITRRDLFHIIKDDSINHATDIFNSMWSNSKDNTLNHRQILLDLVNGLAKEETFEINRESTLFSNYVVNSSCNGCNYCEAICPYKAWKIEETEEIYTLSFNTGRCRSCGQCIKTCPQKAIEKTNILSDDFKGYTPKVEKPKIKCKKCNAKFVLTEKDNELCTACMKREELRKSLFKKN